MLFSNKPILNWEKIEKTALATVEKKETTPSEVANLEQMQSALRTADLWLDSATSLTPEQPRRRILSATALVAQVIPVWQEMFNPVVDNIARALQDMLQEQLKEFGIDPDSIQAVIPGSPLGGAHSILGPETIVREIAGDLFSTQLGTALGEVCLKALGISDTGIPEEIPSASVVVTNIDHWAKETAVDQAELRQFLAVRELAMARLFGAVPWLRPRLINLLQRYANELTVSQEAVQETITEIQEQIQQAMREQADRIREAEDNDQDSASKQNPFANLFPGLPFPGLNGLPGMGMPGMMNAMIGIDLQEIFGKVSLERIFTSEPSEQMQVTLSEFQKLYALIEGWVDEVTVQTCLPYLPNTMKYQELVRRRRAEGAAVERVLGPVVGLKLTPKLSRCATKLWEQLRQNEGVAERDNYWSHPDMMPDLEDLAEPDNFTERRQAQAAAESDFDNELSSLLDGTLGWADGLSPDQDSEGDQRLNLGKEND